MRIDHISEGGFCVYCANKKLCGKQECKICYEKSFASFSIEKKNCIQTADNLLFIFKHSNKKYNFKCFICNHIFCITLKDVSSGYFCPYCGHHKLCGKDKCKICYEKSFASFYTLEKDAIQTTQSLSLIFKYSHYKYNFECRKCKHIYSMAINNFVQGNGCSYCGNTKLCGQKYCMICYEKSFASFETTKKNCIQTNDNLLLIFKYSQRKIQF